MPVLVERDNDADGIADLVDLLVFADLWLSECSAGSPPPGHTAR